jgi:hypothetical protein
MQGDLSSQRGWPGNLHIAALGEQGSGIRPRGRTGHATSVPASQKVGLRPRTYRPLSFQSPLGAARRGFLATLAREFPVLPVLQRVPHRR